MTTLMATLARSNHQKPRAHVMTPLQGAKGVFAPGHAEQTAPRTRYQGASPCRLSPTFRRKKVQNHWDYANGTPYRRRRL